jgi:hypothetical protein
MRQIERGELVTTNIPYVFVSGPSRTIEKSWERFRVSVVGRSSEDAVQSIPAMGGCFLVLTGAYGAVRAVQWPLNWLQANHPPRITLSDLQSFKEAFESPASPFRLS